MNEQKGYIYTMYKGADPGLGWVMTNPIFGKVPTLGACMPNIRRIVKEGDFIFSISGKVKNIKQYVVGGFQVEEKISALAARKRFPENRMHKDGNGNLKGNIIVDKNGNHIQGDYHSNWEKRIENYIVGKKPLYLSEDDEIGKAREQTITILNKIFNKNENDIYKIIGRWRRLDTAQLNSLINWIENLK